MTDQMKNERISAEDVRVFWDGRAKQYRTMELVNVSNLEADVELAREKHRQECAILIEYMRAEKGQVVLDLGAGHGAWTATFARIVEHVDAVEFSEGMIELARQNFNNQGLSNVSLYCCAAQDFSSEKQYDTALLSGLTIYLTDTALHSVLTLLQNTIRQGGRVILRDGTGRDAHFTIRNRYSEELNANYSAHYRTAEQYIEWFSRYGFEIRRHQDMFPEGSPFNKRRETILRIYEFNKVEGGT